MTKAISILTVLIINSLLTFGQIRTPINFDDCKMQSGTFVIAETPPAWKSDSITMIEYFQNVLKNSETMKKLSGKIMMSILVDTDGSTCLNSFSDYDISGFEAEIFQKAVRDMPNWNPAQQAGLPVKFNMTILLKIKKGQVL